MDYKEGPLVYFKIFVNIFSIFASDNGDVLTPFLYVWVTSSDNIDFPTDYKKRKDRLEYGTTPIESNSMSRNLPILYCKLCWKRLMASRSNEATMMDI